MTHLSGRLSQQPFIRVLAEVSAQRRSGVLKIFLGEKVRQLYLDRGQIIRYAASNLVSESLSEQLKQQRRFDKDQIRRGTAAKQPNELLSTALHRLGFLNDEEHRTLVHGIIGKVVAGVASWREGSFEFKRGELPFQQPGEVGVRVSSLILELARKVDDLEPLKDVLGSGKSKLKLHPTSQAALESVSLEPAEGYLVSRGDGTLTVREVVQTSPLGPTETERALCGMILAGILVTEGLEEEESEAKRSHHSKPSFLKTNQHEETRAPSTSVPPAAGPVEEMLERFGALKGQNLYEVLGLKPSDEASEIRHSYYSLAKRLHPDKFFDEKIKAQAEKLFAAITEAYATLYRPESRKEYDESRIFTERAEVQSGGETELARQNFLRGRALLKTGEVVKSLGFFKNAVEQDKGKEEYWHYLGLVQSRNPRFRKEAEQSFLQSIHLDPSRAENYAQLGLLYKKMGQAERAAAYFKKALSWDDSNTTALEAIADEPKKSGLKAFFGK